MGFRGKHKNRRDVNEPEIIATLTAFGIGVETMDTPCDLLCLHHGTVHLVEVKAPKGRLTSAQEEFHARWPVTVLRSAEEAEQWARKVRGGVE